MDAEIPIDPRADSAQRPGDGMMPAEIPRGTSQTSARVSDMGYATWLTKQQAADAIGVTTKTVERFAQEGQVQQARWRRPTGGPELAVYHPDDVARLALERRQGPLPPFVVPTSNRNGHGAIQTRPIAQVAPPAPPAGEDVLRLLVAAARRVMSETSETFDYEYLTVPEAAAACRLSQAYVRRRIAAGAVPAIRDRGWRIRRQDLRVL